MTKMNSDPDENIKELDEKDLESVVGGDDGKIGISEQVAVPDSMEIDGGKKFSP